MRTTEINIKKILGKQTVTRDDGEVVYDKIIKLWGQSGQITINFANLLIASVSFLDEAFGHLALEYSPRDLQKKLRFVKINDYDRALLNDIILSRVREKSLTGQTAITKRKIRHSRQKARKP